MWGSVAGRRASRGFPGMGRGKGRANVPVGSGVYVLFGRGRYKNQEVASQINPSDCHPRQVVTAGYMTSKEDQELWAR